MQNKNYNKIKEDRRNNPKSDLDQEERLKMLATAASNNSLLSMLAQTDLEVIADWGKAFKFLKGQILAKRGQVVDYLGVLLSGRAFYKNERNTYSWLDMGKIVGSMSLLGFEGTGYHQFDLLGEVEGFIWCLRHDEFKSMVKASPQTGAKLLQVLAVNCVQLVHYQLFGACRTKSNDFSETKIPEKKIHDLFEGCQLKSFWKGLDRRQQRALCSVLQMVQVLPKSVAVHKGSNGDFLLFVLKGQLTYFTQGETKFIESGVVLGLGELIQGRMHKNNIYCRTKGYMGVLTKGRLEELASQNISCVNKLILYLTLAECQRIKSVHEGLTGQPSEPMMYQLSIHSSLSLQSKQANEGDQTQDKLKQSVAEISPLFQNVVFIKKRRGKEDQEASLREAELEKSNQEAKEKDKEIVARLFRKHEGIIFGAPVALSRSKKSSERKSKTQRSPERSIERSESKDKLDRQSNADRAKRAALTSFYQIGQYKASVQHNIPLQNFYQERLQKSRPQRKNVALHKAKPEPEDPYQRIRRSCKQMQSDNKSLRSMIEQLSEQNKNSLMAVNDLQHRNALMTSKVHMSLVLKELQRKVESKQIDKDTLLTAKQGGPVASGKGTAMSSVSLNDVLGEQLQFSSRYKTVVRCAYRWLYLTKKRLKERKS